VRVMRVVRDDAVNLTLAAGLVPSTRNVLKTVLANDSFTILLLCRLRALARRCRILGLNHILRRIQTIGYGIEIANGVELGSGVYFVHPVGMVIGGDARIGDRVRFMGGNTVGTVRDNGYPVVEEDVTVGAGARLLGPIRVGARSVIGANAVVLRDVPADTVAVGIPARLRARRDAGRTEVELRVQ
jgi:serine O-acetyltransferase